MKHTILLTLLLLLSTNLVAKDELPTSANILAASSASDWRTPDAKNIMVMQLAQGQVIFELATDFAPDVIENIRLLVAEKYFDGLSVIRSQDNYVVQFADPDGGEKTAKSFGKAKHKVAAEFYRKLEGLPFTKIVSQDAYTDQVGFSNGFPVGHDGQRAWLTHCYAMLGVGRGSETDSGSGAELYVVTGHAPRHLDRNVTLIGRVLKGIELFSTLPRGTGELGFYANADQYTEVQSIRFADQLTGDEQIKLQVLRTDTPTFEQYVKARTTRVHPWFIDKVGKIGVCNVNIPVRDAD